MIVITGDEEKGDDGKNSMAITMVEVSYAIPRPCYN